MKTILSLIFAVLSFCGCSENKDSYLISFGNFVEEVNNDFPNYTEVDWESADDKYYEFVTIIEQKIGDRLTSDDKVKLAKQKGAYKALHLKGKAKQAKDNLENVIKKSKADIEEMQEYVE